MLKTKKILQRDLSDCGAACLAAIAAHYKLELPISKIRQFAGTDQKGTNVLGLIEAAEKMGFQAKGAKGTITSLSKIPLPAIAHVVVHQGYHHYVVIYKVTKTHITIMDPADGKLYKKTIESFNESWTGVLILLIPGTEFTEGNSKVSNLSRFWALINPQRTIMFQALLGAIVYTVLGLSTALYVQKIVDYVLVEGNLRLLNLLGAVMILILIFQVFVGTVKSILALQAGQHIDARLILGYYKHLFKLPQRFFDTMRVGDIISRIGDAVKIRSFINDVAIELFVNTLIIFLSISVMFVFYWKLALIMLSIIPLYLFLFYLNNRINIKWQRRLMENSADLETQLVESLNAAGTIKRFGLEDYANFRTENRFVALLKTIYSSRLYSIFIANSSDFFTRLFTVVILWAGSYFVIQNELTTGELLSFFALIGYFTQPASSLINANKDIQEALIAADRLFEIIDLETEDSSDQKINLTPALLGDIVFRNVHFRYGTRTVVFTGLNLKIEKGKRTGVVGESGSGKSTLLSLLQNLYTLDEGSIHIGGMDLRQVSNRSLREIVGVVPQQIDLFAGTILENIAVGEFEPDMLQVIRISELLGIDEFIEKLPDSYHTMLDEQGTNLSGGQKQRLAIARALYRNPEILILDEATSNLDPANERKVQAALDWFGFQGKTIIIIAHKLASVRNCDKILALHEGKLLEEGTHIRLLEQDGYYASLWRHNQMLI